MAKDTTSNNIKIHFRAEGEQELTNAIKTLSAATKQLKNSQVQLAKSIGMTDAQRKKSIATGNLALRNQRNMNAATAQGSMTFSVFRSKLLLASFATGLFAASVGKLVRAFAEQESSEKRIDAALESTKNVVGLTGAEIKEFTRGLEDIGVIGDEVNNKMASILLTFTNIRGEAFEKTMVAANNMAISISGGIPTFEQLKSSALQLGKALQDPAGQLGALSRSGFTFTGTQKQMIKNLVEQNKLQEAQNIILEAAETQFGGLNEAMVNTVDGAYAQMNNAAGTLAENIGAVLAPATIEFAHNMTDLFKSLSENTRQIVVVTKTIIDLGAAFMIYKTAVALSNKQSKLFLALQAAMRPQTALVAAGVFLAAKGFYELNDAITDDIIKVNESNDAFKKMIKNQKNLASSVETTTSKMSQQSLQMKLSNELKISNINIENSALLGLTRSEIRSFEGKKRTLLIQKELIKVDKDKREGVRAETEAYVDNVIAYEKYITSIKEHIKEQKELIQIDKFFLTIDESIRDAQKESLILMAKEAAINSKNQKFNIDRVNQLIELDKRLAAVGLEGIPNFIDALADESVTVSSLVDEHEKLNSVISDAIFAFGEAIENGVAYNEALEGMKEVIKAINKEKSPFDQFTEDAQLALTSVQGFSQAYSTLIDERMNRELEALKTTRDFEEASQEQREVMENKIEQRFKNQRKKAFQIEKASNLAEAIMDVRSAYAEALKRGPGFAAFVAALGFAQVSAIAAQPAPRFATGGSFITTGTQNLVVGEQGAERVTIQPLGGRRAQQGSNETQVININVSAPLVDETILDVIIPKIEEAGKLNLA